MNKPLFEFKDKTYQLAVEKMHSAHCLARVENAALTVVGVYQAKAILSEGLAEISGGEPEEVAAAISAVGYPASMNPVN